MDEVVKKQLQATLRQNNMLKVHKVISKMKNPMDLWKRVSGKAFGTGLQTDILSKDCA